MREGREDSAAISATYLVHATSSGERNIVRDGGGRASCRRRCGRRCSLLISGALANSAYADGFLRAWDPSQLELC